MPAFAVLDFETTGFRPGRDRVVEVAIVVVDQGLVVDEWATLINPGGPVVGTHVHGIRSRDVKDAPSFPEVVGDVLERVAGRVAVAHNARFDSAFLVAELARAGYTAEAWEWLCTLNLVAQLRFSATLSLRASCANLGVPHEDGHSALIDAQATARLMNFLFAVAYERGEEVNLPPCVDDAPVVSPSGRHVERPTKRPNVTGPPLRHVDSTSVALPELVQREAALAYMEMLDRVLEDRVITEDETLSLCELAVGWGLAAGDLASIHRSYMAALAKAAVADGVITRQEHDDLRLFAQLLGVDAAVVLEALMEPLHPEIAP